MIGFSRGFRGHNMTREVRLELLIGKAVINVAGRRVAHVEEVQVEADGHDYVVTRYLTGSSGYLERVAGVVEDIPFLRLLPFVRRFARSRPIPWQWLNIADPERPRLTVLPTGTDDPA